MPSWPWTKFKKAASGDKRSEQTADPNNEGIAGRKLDRFKINSFHQTSLTLEIEGKSYAVPIINMSSQGLAFANTLQDFLIKVGESIQGRFLIQGRECFITINVRHKTHSTVGCFVENYAASYSKFIEDYFVQEIEGSKLFPVSIKADSNEKKSIERLYLINPSSTCSLYLETVEDKIHRLQINLLGNSIQINESNLLSYGFAIEDEDVDSQFAPQVTIKINHLPPDLVGHCLRFIGHIDLIDETIKTQINEKLQKSNHLKAA
jgi:hypothetical protein